MKNTSLITVFLIIIPVAAYFVSPSLSAGLFTGIVSLFLIRIFLLSLIRTGSNVKIVVMFLNVLKFGIVIAMLYIFIKVLRFDPIMLAIGYSAVFLLTVTEVFIRRPKEL